MEELNGSIDSTQLLQIQEPEIVSNIEQTQKVARIFQGEIKMADPVTMSDVAMLASQHSDIRSEAAAHTNEIVKEGIKSEALLRGDIKDARYDINTNVANRFFDIGRDTSDLRAQVVSVTQQMTTGFNNVAKDTEIASLKTQIEMQKNTNYLSDKVTSDGDKTRELINELRTNDLNRLLLERQIELFDERHHGRFWRHGYDNAQWNAVQSNLNAFQSQLAETRQGMVNFGTMAGVGQTSTSNNVR